MGVPVTLIATSAIELAKVGAQIYFASARQAGLTEEQQQELLDSERLRFQENIKTPLPDV
jgi:hypothetical protein